VKLATFFLNRACIFWGDFSPPKTFSRFRGVSWPEVQNTPKNIGQKTAISRKNDRLIDLHWFLFGAPLGGRLSSFPQQIWRRTRYTRWISFCCDFVSSCGHAKAVEIRVDWAKRMWELVQAETSRRTSPLDIYGRGECTATNVEGGGRMSPSNVTTWSEKHHTRY
jgi:hypothetical protein